MLRGGEELKDVVERVEVGRRKVSVKLVAGIELAGDAAAEEAVCVEDGHTLLMLPAVLKWRGGSKVAVGPTGASAVESCKVDLPLLKALVRAEAWKARLLGGEFATIADLAIAEKLDDQYVRVVFRLAFLSPAIKRGILEGSPGATTPLTSWLAKGVPLAWADQAAQRGL